VRLQNSCRYARQPSSVNPQVTNGRQSWIDLEKGELLCWFGILILMGLKDEPSVRRYWATIPFFNCPLVSQAMSHSRFEAIMRCVHLVNNEDLIQDPKDRAFDKIGKVHWLLERYARISQSLYNNERILTIDEIMVLYKGRFCNIRQYMKAKPVTFGIKLWAVVLARSRYISNAIVYLGLGDTRTEGESVGEDAVLTAIRRLEGRSHVVVTDNYFTSPRLCMILMDRGFWSTGTFPCEHLHLCFACQH
jgi:hypothetical protein